MAFSRSRRFTFASSYVTFTSCFVLSEATALTPFTSLSAASVRAAQPPQCHPETLIVSVFSAASAPNESSEASSGPAMSFFMGASLSHPWTSQQDEDSMRSSGQAQGAARVLRGGARQLVRRQAPQRGQRLRRQGNIGRLVALPPVRERGSPSPPGCAPAAPGPPHRARLPHS